MEVVGLELGDQHARQQAAAWIEAVELRWIEFERGGIAGDQRRRVVAGVALRQAAIEVHTGLRLQPAVEEIALKLQLLAPPLLACNRDVGIADAERKSKRLNSSYTYPPRMPSP